MLDWRQLSKLKGTYTDALQRAIDAKTGRVHTSYKMPARRPGGSPRPIPTCRTSRCAPRKAARSAEAFIAEPGHMLLSAPTIRRSSSGCWPHIADIAALKEAFARRRSTSTP